MPPTEEHIPSQQSEAALRPRGLPSPNEPSQQERDLHDLTHLPYRRWCSVCVQAKRQTLTTSYDSRPNACHPHRCCVHAVQGTTWDVATIFTGVDVRTQMAMAVTAPSKSVNRNGLTELKRCIYDTGRTQAIRQCDDENS